MDDKILHQLGFIGRTPQGKYVHHLSGEEFDFSANSLEGIVTNIFQSGKSVSYHQSVSSRLLCDRRMPND